MGTLGDLAKHQKNERQLILRQLWEQKHSPGNSKHKLIYKNFDAKLAKPNKVNFDDVKVVKKETQKEESHNNTNKARIRALNKKQAMIDKQLRRSEKQKKRALFLKMLEEEKRLRWELKQKAKQQALIKQQQQRIIETKRKNEFHGYIVPKWVNYFVTTTLVITGLFLCATLVILGLYVFTNDDFIEFVTIDGVWTPWCYVALIGTLLVLILGCTAVVLHILDSKSRKEIVTRKLLNRTRNAITNENKVLKINRNLTNSIKQLEASNDIKKTQIKNLNGKLQKSNASVAVSLSAQKKVKFLEARIEEMKSHPTLEEKMVYRQKISALKKRERSELEAERRKRQEIRLQAKNQTNQYMLHPISQTPPEEPKNLTPLQKHQWMLERVQAKLRFQGTVIAAADRIYASEINKANEAKTRLLNAKNQEASLKKQYQQLSRDQHIRIKQRKLEAKQKRREEKLARKAARIKEKNYQKEVKKARKLEAIRLKKMKKDQTKVTTANKK